MLLLSPGCEASASFGAGSQDPAKLADLGASMCSADEAALQEVVETTNVLKRLQLTLVLLKKEMELSRLQADIGKRVEEKISADQRKYFLNEQLKSIQKELGLVKDERTALVTRFEERLKPFEKGLTEDARRVITEELNKLKALEPSSSEFNVSRNYLEWLTSMPWGHYSQDILDVKKAQAVRRPRSSRPASRESEGCARAWRRGARNSCHAQALFSEMFFSLPARGPAALDPAAGA